jgi:hypothetical protein
MSFEAVFSWVAVLTGGLSPILVSFVALVIGRSRRRKVYYRRLASQLKRADRGIALTVLTRQSRSALSSSLYCPFDGGSETSGLGGRGSWTGSGLSSLRIALGVRIAKEIASKVTRQNPSDNATTTINDSPRGSR